MIYSTFPNRFALLNESTAHQSAVQLSSQIPKFGISDFLRLNGVHKKSHFGEHCFALFLEAEQSKVKQGKREEMIIAATARPLSYTCKYVCRYTVQSMDGSAVWGAAGLKF